MKLRTFVIALLTCLLVSSCSSNLSRSKAEEIIRANEKFPSNREGEEFYLYWVGHCFQNRVEGPCGPDAMSEGKPAMSEKERALQASGLITVTYDGPTSRIALTPKAQQYVLGVPSVRSGSDGNGNSTPLSVAKVVTSTDDFGSITGITQADDSKSAQVEYTIIVKPTPFGTGGPPSTLRQTARFTKYDDGWRISR